MRFTGGITNIAHFTYTPASNIFLMLSLENKLFLYDFGSSGITFIREYSATLQNSKNLVYVKGTNYFISNDNGDAKIIDARTGQMSSPQISVLNGFGVETIHGYTNPTNQKTYLVFAEPNGMFHTHSTLLQDRSCVAIGSCPDSTSNCQSTWPELNICRACSSGWRLIGSTCSQSACPQGFYNNN